MAFGVQVIQRSRMTGRRPLAEKRRASTAATGATRAVCVVVLVARVLVVDKPGKLTERFKQVGDFHRAVPPINVPVGRFFQDQ